ncbi:hypothetical protein LO772_20300 [Yinghuangia sp. ASG 101]|uniref:hypothetical protein n=1 Tax=Yinghuangia sp. ASG 101 TaxID=2896848 RepID=UPI001E48017D|nr:hypothetical protein [Yinghuangia sp. ASG 101]UGQ09287.1 hypothetical protein LO772_20300 [Yinghuangia sp. ASG 101]
MTAIPPSPASSAGAPAVEVTRDGRDAHVVATAPTHTVVGGSAGAASACAFAAGPRLRFAPPRVAAAHPMRRGAIL